MSRSSNSLDHIWKFSAAILPTAVALAGCSSAVMLPRHLAQPADASVRVPPPTYSSVTGQTQSYRPVGPRDWTDLNRRVGPKQ